MSFPRPNTSTGVGASFVYELGANDVLLGRGAPVIKYEGNVRFRKLILERKAEYAATMRTAAKDLVARRIVQEIGGRGGRFLRRVELLEETRALGLPAGVRAWTEADDDAVLEKVKQAFRDSHKGDAGVAADTVSSPEAHSAVARQPPPQPFVPSFPIPLPVLQQQEQPPNPQDQRFQEQQALPPTVALPPRTLQQEQPPNPNDQRLREQQHLLLQSAAFLQQQRLANAASFSGDLPSAPMGYTPEQHRNLALLQQLQRQHVQQQRRQQFLALLQQPLPPQQATLLQTLPPSVLSEIPGAYRDLLSYHISRNMRPQFTWSDLTMLLQARDAAAQRREDQRLTQEVEAVLGMVQTHCLMPEGDLQPQLRHATAGGGLAAAATGGGIAVASQPPQPAAAAVHAPQALAPGSGSAAVLTRKRSAETAAQEDSDDNSGSSDSEKKPRAK